MFNVMSCNQRVPMDHQATLISAATFDFIESTVSICSASWIFSTVLNRQCFNFIFKFGELNKLQGGKSGEKS